MEEFLVTGGKRLTGQIQVSGSKNMALKALVAACLTTEKVTLHNIPLISDLLIMTQIIQELGGTVEITDHTLTLQMAEFKKSNIELDKAAQIRTAAMFIAPLLARTGTAIIPNPGGCRIGARPIDRIIDGLKEMGVEILYDSQDGYFYAKQRNGKLKGTRYHFEKNTHTGTETLILASVLAEGETILENCAQEPEVDQLIELLNSMGASIHRAAPRTIVIQGVPTLHGTAFAIHSDRNEIVTFAIAALITDGDIFIKDVKKSEIASFLEKLQEAGAGIEEKEKGVRFFYKNELRATDVITSSYPGFMTDWQAPWAVLMTKAHGISTIHETVYESRFGYVQELQKMGAKIELFNPEVKNAEKFYNFNLDDDSKQNYHAAKIHGPSPLHNAVVKVSDLRAGATLVLGALAAKGRTSIFGIELLDRGYEEFEQRLKSLGAEIERVKKNT